jgi:hypothetical protein
MLFVAATIAIATGRNPNHTPPALDPRRGRAIDHDAPLPASSETDVAEGRRRPRSTV